MRQFSSFFIAILLARLLGPKEFGIVAMAMIVINISSVFTDIGFTNALIQKKSVKDIAYSSVFFINLGLGFVLSLLIIIAAPWIAFFFEEPSLKQICMYLSVIPPLSALGSIHTTILTKRIDFKSLTIRNIVASLAAGILAVIAAFSGLGVYSLVIQHIVSVGLSTVMVWFAVKWFPRFEFSKEEIKKLLSYSSYIFLDNVIRRIFLNIDSAFIGKVFSPVTLGVYYKAQSLRSQIETLSTQSLNKVIFPVFSEIQDDDKNFRATYLRAFNIISGVMVLLIAPFYFLSDIIVINLLGEQWFSSILIFEILILSTVVSPQGSIMAKALLAKGYSKYRFKIGLLQRIVMLLPISVGFFWGINAFAFALVIAQYLIFLVLLVAIHHKLHIDFWMQVRNVVIPNLLFFATISIDKFLGINLNRWLIVSFFMFSQILYLKAMKHESYAFAVGTFQSLKIILRRRLGNKE